MANQIFTSFKHLTFPGRDGCFELDQFLKVSANPKIHYIGENVREWFLKDKVIIRPLGHEQLITGCVLSKSTLPRNILSQFPKGGVFIPFQILRWLMNDEYSFLSKSGANIIFTKRKTDQETVVLAICWESAKGWSFRGYEMDHIQKDGNTRLWFKGVQVIIPRTRLLSKI